MIEQPSILIIDDEEDLRFMLSAMLRKQGYCTETAQNGAEGLAALADRAYDYILCDIKMPVMDGETFLKGAILQGVRSPIIMMTAYGSVDTAVACMQEGAYDFISKPFKQDEIIIVLKKAEERERLKAENQRLKAELDGQEFCGLVGRNPAMLAIYEQMGRVAPLGTTVLILGESGTGKELVAKGLHQQGGSRSSRPFIAINCGAIPESMLEGELFGHVKGAFTGAIADKPGLLEQADGGTIFLDEIGDMPPALQVKLLRVLQDGEVRRIGALTSKKVDLRVVSATARDLQAEVQAGRFREDLYFRLNVFSLLIPPLRERIDDIPLLVNHLVRHHAERLGLPQVPKVMPDLLRALISYSWPGNVRELENCMERGLVLCDGEQLNSNCLPQEVLPVTGDKRASEDDENLSIKQAERILEMELISKALARTGGNRTQAARILEISLRALMYKIKEYGLE